MEESDIDLVVFGLIIFIVGFIASIFISIVAVILTMFGVTLIAWALAPSHNG